MDDSEFGIGFVGAGFITQESHVPSLEYIPGAHAAGILNPTQERAEGLAAACRSSGVGDPTVYGEDEVAALVRDPAVDGLWVTSPNFTRVDVVEQAVEAVADGATLSGIAMEKPLARNLAEAERIIEAVSRVDLPHAYLENWPHEPEIENMHRLLWSRGRDAGRPYLARSQAEHGGPHSGWFWDGSLQGGGALTDMLCHALAGNAVLLGDPDRGGADLDAVAVSADAETLKWGRAEYAAQLAEEYGVDYETSPADDYARATVRYESETGETLISEATGSWCYIGAGVRRSIELLGPEYSGRVETDEASSSVFFSDEIAGGEGWAEKQTATSGRMPVTSAVPVTGGFVAENRDAIESFQDGRNGRLDFHDGWDVLELCMAAYKSAEEGAEVELAEVDLTDFVPQVAQ